MEPTKDNLDEEGVDMDFAVTVMWLTFFFTLVFSALTVALLYQFWSYGVGFFYTLK